MLYKTLYFLCSSKRGKWKLNIFNILVNAIKTSTYKRTPIFKTKDINHIF